MFLEWLNCKRRTSTPLFISLFAFEPYIYSPIQFSSLTESSKSRVSWDDIKNIRPLKIQCHTVIVSVAFSSLMLVFVDKIRYLTLTDAGKVWMPDTFFRNEKIARFHKILAPNLYIRIYPDGDVLYSIRFQVQTFICQGS